MIFGKATTYKKDLPLFKELGLKPFEVETNEEIFVGTYKDYDTKVEIYVSCMPAMFWKFKITTYDSEEITVETGSGTLTEYWDSIVKISTNMLVVT